MANALFYLAAFAFVLGVLVVVHELGHFTLAKLCGVKVLRFSVGFGKVLWGRRFGPDQTEWVLSAFPLGGYVKMLDEREGPVAEEELPRAFNRQSLGKRFAIVAAGPLANLCLAVLVYWAMFWHGMEELRPLLGTPPAGTAAAMAGIRNGDLVDRVGDTPVATWQALRWEILRKGVKQPGGVAPLVLQAKDAQGRPVWRYLDISPLGKSGFQGDPMGVLGVQFFQPDMAPVVGRVTPGSAADKGGMRAGDRIEAIEGKPTAQWQAVVALIRPSAGRPLRFQVLRLSQRLTLVVTPVAASADGGRVGRIGVEVQGAGISRDRVFVTLDYGPLGSLRKALAETWAQSSMSVVMMGKMLTGTVSWRNLSGPVTIADYAGQSARMGWLYYFQFLALVSVSLGVLNLLPIPILDGGHLLYYMAEFIRRKPLSQRTMEIGQQIGLALLLAMMAFAFFNDINRLISG